jgi:hypothetical protein
MRGLFGFGTINMPPLWGSGVWGMCGGYKRVVPLGLRMWWRVVSYQYAAPLGLGYLTNTPSERVAPADPHSELN